MTNDGALSQDEIEALLQGADDAFGGDNNKVKMGTEVDGRTMDEAVKVIIDNQAFSLSSVVTKNVTMSNISVATSTAEGLKKILAGKLLEIKVSYSTGNMYYYIRESEAVVMSTLMMGQQETELTEMTSQALKEAFSQMIGVSDSALINKFNGTLENIGIEINILNDSSSVNMTEAIVVASNNLSIEGEIQNSPYIFAIDMPLLVNLTNRNKPNNSGFNNNPNNSSNGSFVNRDGNLNVQHADFNNLMPSTDVSEANNIGLLMDVTMNITVELGRATMTIREILSLGEGSIIELQKLAGEPVDLLVNGKLIARGEVVVIDENFGVRVTDIISQAERITAKTR